MLIEKNPECIFNEIENTAVILNPSTEKFLELNATCLLIWKELDQTNNLDELISNIQKSFPLQAEIEEDIRNFIKLGLNTKIFFELN